jgi:hypothetical protein
MERRYFLGLTFGLIAGAAALAGSAQAAPLAPISAQQLIRTSPAGVEGAIVTQDEIDRIKPEQVRWGHHGHGHHWGWHHRRHWGWHHRHWGWRHRHWGWRHHHWHHRHWHHRHWW